jgi:hypothetical protein
VTTITLTADPAGSPAPYVDVLVEDFPVGVEAVTVWRTSPSGRAFRVRGLVRVSTGGVVTIRDFEAPLGAEVSYRAEHLDGAGDFVSWSDSETVTLTEGLIEDAWFHNPFDPTTSVHVVITLDAAQEISRPVDVEKFKVKGRSVPVIISGPRRGVEQLVLDCSTLTLADATKFDALFGTYDDDTVPIVCVRTHPNLFLPPTLFAVIEDPIKRPTIARQGGTVVDWLLLADETAPPVEAAITALLDYADFTAYYSDYAEFTAAYADYREAQRDYSIAEP